MIAEEQRKLPQAKVSIWTPRGEKAGSETLSTLVVDDHELFFSKSTSAGPKLVDFLIVFWSSPRLFHLRPRAG